MGKTFYISDLHFGHINCLTYDNRPFRNIEEHDNELIRRWNETVGVDDEVWILGDISWYNATKTVEIFNRLNGIKHLCVGNHDKKMLKNKDIRDLFIEIVDYKEIRLNDKIGVVLCHYPIPCYNHHYHGWYHLYGHVHNSFEWNMMNRVQHDMKTLYGKDSHMYNVGCMIDYMDYTPRTLEDIISRTSSTLTNNGRCI